MHSRCELAIRPRSLSVEESCACPAETEPFPWPVWLNILHWRSRRERSLSLTVRPTASYRGRHPQQSTLVMAAKEPAWPPTAIHSPTAAWEKSKAGLNTRNLGRCGSNRRGMEGREERWLEGGLWSELMWWIQRQALRLRISTDLHCNPHAAALKMA